VKRKAIGVVTGVAMTAMLMLAAVGVASADENADRCAELRTGIQYNMEEGNNGYVEVLLGLARNRNCGFDDFIPWVW
jgi:hypothetical protein